jgi:hypothetical protein
VQEYTTQCYCANILGSTSTQLAQSSCNIPCGGNKTQTCGGSNAISLYNNTLYSPTRIVYTAVVPGNAGVSFNYTGCYTDNVSGRALGAYGPSSTTPMTVEVCAGVCFTQGYTYMGLEVLLLLSSLVDLLSLTDRSMRINAFAVMWLLELDLLWQQVAILLAQLAPALAI